MNIINYYRKKEKDSLMLQVMQDCRQDVISMFEDAYSLEEAWSEYLFSKGSVLGLNRNVYLQYIQHLIGNRLKNLGISSKYSKIANPCTWVNKWLGVQDAEQGGFVIARSPQEVQLTDYKINSINNEVNLQKYKDFL